MSDTESKDYFGPKHRYVKELSVGDFESTSPWKLKDIDDKKIRGMVLFYAPWCGHCKALKSVWEKAAITAGFCDFYAFNCEKNKAHVSKIKEDMPQLINGFPTIVIYKDGSPDEYYQGERSVEALISTCMRICSNKRSF